MRYEIIKKGAKFFIQDTESGELVGDPKGYKDRKQAQKAMKSIESAESLPAPSVKPPGGLPAPGPGAMAGGPMGMPQGMPMLPGMPPELQKGMGM